MFIFGHEEGEREMWGGGERDVQFYYLVVYDQRKKEGGRGERGKGGGWV